MISKSQKKRIKNILGHNYSSLILEYLNDNNIRTRHGLPYTSYSTIRATMNGKQNEEVEKAIFKVVEIKKQEILSETENRKRILQLKKA